MSRTATDEPRPARRASRRSRLVRAVLAALIGLAAVVGVTELAASFTRSGNVVGFVWDPDLLLVRKPGSEGWAWTNGRWTKIRLNALHMRGEELPATRDPEETRILVLGDSVVYAQGLFEEDTFCVRLDERLSAERPVRVLNGGANGWDTHYQRLFLERKAMRADPDLVILAWNWNDLVDPDVTGPIAQRAMLVGDECWVCRLGFGQDWIRNSHVYSWVSGRKHGIERLPTDEQIAGALERMRSAHGFKLRGPEEAVAEDRARRFGERPPSPGWWRATDSRLWSMARREMTALAAFCREQGVRFAVVLLPDTAWEGPGDIPGTERMVALLDELEVPWLSLQQDFLIEREDGTRVGRNPALWGRYDVQHPYEEGHELIAQRIAEFLAARDLVGRRPEAR